MSATPVPATPAAQPTVAQLTALVAELEAKLAQSKQPAPRQLLVKASEKGGVSVYGLGRFPVTLYAGQWERLLAHAEEISAFITAHPELARKPESK